MAVSPQELAKVRERLTRITSQSLQLVGLLEKEEAKVEAATADKHSMQAQLKDLEAEFVGTWSAAATLPMLSLVPCVGGCARG